MSYILLVLRQWWVLLGFVLFLHALTSLGEKDNTPLWSNPCISSQNSYSYGQEAAKQGRRLWCVCHCPSDPPETAPRQQWRSARNWCLPSVGHSLYTQLVCQLQQLVSFSPKEGRRGGSLGKRCTEHKVLKLEFVLFSKERCAYILDISLQTSVVLRTQLKGLSCWH